LYDISFSGEKKLLREEKDLNKDKKVAAVVPKGW
jgi:hypothetical protein